MNKFHKLLALLAVLALVAAACGGGASDTTVASTGDTVAPTDSGTTDTTMEDMDDMAMPGEGVEVDPIEPLPDKPVEEQPRNARPGVTIGMRVRHVGKIAGEVFAVRFGQWQAPRFVIIGAPGVDHRLRSCVIACHHRGIIRPQRHPRRHVPARGLRCSGAEATRCRPEHEVGEGVEEGLSASIA